jgi:hypothetical protein
VLLLFDDVHAGLVLVHRVQDYLERNKDTLIILQKLEFCEQIVANLVSCQPIGLLQDVGTYSL